MREQQAMLNRTFGCVRVVWNRTLAATARAATTPRARACLTPSPTRALTAMKKDPGLEFLNEVSSVPLQQALRHQHKAFTAFFARRARYPRFKSRTAPAVRALHPVGVLHARRRAAAGQDEHAACGSCGPGRTWT